MARGKKKKAETQEDVNPETEERKRLKSLAYSNNVLSEFPANEFFPLSPSKTVIKHHGKDILKKSQRKNRYLFSFSGLLAPISGGKIGELTDLGSKNPILYLNFPQGRMKLFGTIVYPKNRYLTLQFSRSGKNVMCEDCFDTMIVFSDACWVGKKEENPDEVRLDFPEELYEGKQSEFDFQGGAGATAVKSKDVKKVIVRSAEEDSPSDSPVDNMETEPSERQHNLKDINNSTPVRHSERTSRKRFSFAEVSSGDDSAGRVSDMSGGANDEAAKNDQDSGILEIGTEIQNSEDIQHSTAKAPLSSLSCSGANESSRSSLVQTTLSTLFKKVEQTNAAEGGRKMATYKVSKEKMQPNSSKLKTKNVKMQVVTQDAELRKEESISRDRKTAGASDRKKHKAELVEVEDDIEDFSSASEEIDGSDDDWHA